MHRAPLLRGSGELHVVGRDDITSIRDPDGAIHWLVRLADGSRTTAELFAAVLVEYPQIDEREVLEALQRLQSAGLLDEDEPR